VPRRGIVVVRRTNTEIVDMIRAWAALESMAALLDHDDGAQKDISALRAFFKDFTGDRLPQDHVEEYSKANIAFHQALISLSESQVLVDMTNDILLHVRGYRQPPTPSDGKSASRRRCRSTWPSSRPARGAQYRTRGKASARSHPRARRLCRDPRPELSPN